MKWRGSRKRKCHFDEIFITGCTGSCHQNDAIPFQFLSASVLPGGAESDRWLPETTNEWKTSALGSWYSFDTNCAFEIKPDTSFSAQRNNLGWLSGLGNVGDGINHTGIILCMRPAKERRRYIVMSSPIGWAHTQNDPCHICSGSNRIQSKNRTWVLGKIKTCETGWRHNIEKFFAQPALCEGNPSANSVLSSHMPSNADIQSSILIVNLLAEQFVEQTVELWVIWDGMAHMWRHCNDKLGLTFLNISWRLHKTPQRNRVSKKSNGRFSGQLVNMDSWRVPRSLYVPGSQNRYTCDKVHEFESTMRHRFHSVLYMIYMTSQQ